MERERHLVSFCKTECIWLDPKLGIFHEPEHISLRNYIYIYIIKLYIWIKVVGRPEAAYIAINS